MSALDLARHNEEPTAMLKLPPKSYRTGHSCQEPLLSVSARTRGYEHL